MSKCLLLHSGGLRSTVLASVITAADDQGIVVLGNKNREQFKSEKRSREDIVLMHISYHQPSYASEIYYSKMTKIALGIPDWRVAIVKEGIPETLSEVNFKDGVFMVGHKRGEILETITEVILSVCKHFDCKEVFSGEESVGRSLIFGELPGGLRVRKPLLGVSTTDVLSIGRSLGSPVKFTWSCHRENMMEKCGICSKCLERSNAYKKNGIVDEVETIKEILP